MGTVKTVALLSSALAMLAGAPAFAQDSATAQTPVEDGNREEIVVTALKREQLLIDVPQSVSVVSGDSLERQQATNFQDYLKLVPGLQLEQSTPGFGRLILRGINTGGVASTVAVYADETPFGSSSAQTNGAILAGDFDTFDVARVEVLRGPQGTLYGANSLGGILKFVTNAPRTDRLEARGRATVETVRGGDLSYQGSALFNLPLGDKLAFRASGFYRKVGGFIDSVGTAGSDVENDINDVESYGGRASLLFKPSEKASIRLSAIVQDLNAGAASAVESDPVTTDALYGRLTQSQFVPENSKVRYRVYNGTLNFDLGFADLVSSTSYATLTQKFRSDATTLFQLIGLPVLDYYNDQQTRVERLTQELRLSSPSDETFEWLLGAYYTREKGTIDQFYQAVEPGTLTPNNSLGLIADAFTEDNYREYAGFANATIHFTDRLDLTFGGRYSHNRQRYTTDFDGLLVGGSRILSENNRSSENVFTYSVAPSFEVSDRATVYARVAKGYRPGGPNTLPAGAPAGTPSSFGSDTLVSYEAGIKAESADGSFTIDLAGFHIDWNDIQLFTRINNVGLNINGAGATSDGAEFTATLRPTRGLAVSLNGAYTDAKLTSDTDNGGRDGDALPYTPKYSLNVNGDYEWSVGGDATAYLGASLRFLSKQPGAFDGAFVADFGRQRYIPSYEVVDLRAGLNLGRYSIEVFARNLTDSKGKTSADQTSNAPFGALTTGVIRPRSVGVTLSAGL